MNQPISNTVQRNDARNRAPGPQALWVLITGLVVINLAFSIAMLHVFHSHRYRGTGSLRDLLLAALILNGLSAGLVIVFRLRFGWRQKWEIVLASQCVASLQAFALIPSMKIPQPDVRMYVFGLVYAVFVYFHCATLFAYCFSNSQHFRHERSSFHMWVFAVSLLIYAAMTPWAKLACYPTADEPHYLLLTHSLVFDHDFDLTNNYAKGDYKKFYPPEIPASDHHAVMNARGEQVPVHDVGVSILLGPGYALAGRLGAMLELNVFGALLALGMFLLAINLGASCRPALACWGLFAFTSPVAIYTSQIYPEIVGGAATVWAIIAYLKFTDARSWRYLLLATSAVSVLPWLSIRYWAIVGTMLGVICVHLMLSGMLPRAAVFKTLQIMLLPLLISMGIFAAFDLHWYQTPIPNAGYVLLLRPRPSLFTPHLLPGLPGLLFDRAFGLLATAPVYLLAIAGAWVLCRRRPWHGALIVLPSLAYVLLAALNRFWYGGWAPPPRYIVTAVPVLVPLAALVLSDRSPRLLLSAVAGWSFFIATAYTAFPLTRYTHWNVSSGALSDFVARTVGFHFGVVFPSFIRSSGVDYLLGAAWAAFTIGFVRIFVSTSRSVAGQGAVAQRSDRP